MTDPVDTDALRIWSQSVVTTDDVYNGWTGEAQETIAELCDQVDHLRAELAEAERRFEHAAAVANAEKRRADTLRDDQEGLVDQHSLIKPREEVRRLREVIGGAPHARSCELEDGLLTSPSWDRSCTCWKAAVS